MIEDLVDTNGPRGRLGTPLGFVFPQADIPLETQGGARSGIGLGCLFIGSPEASPGRFECRAALIGNGHGLNKSLG